MAKPEESKLDRLKHFLFGGKGGNVQVSHLRPHTQELVFSAELIKVMRTAGHLKV